MGFGVGFSEPYYETISEDTPPSGIPNFWHVLIGDHTYAVDTEFKPYLRDAFRHRTTPAQRESVDLTNIPGEGTVNPDGPWRRGAVDWSLGAGQLFLDRKASADNRFFKSKGIDPFTVKWQATLLPDTELVFAVTGNVKAMCAGAYTYVMDFDGDQVQFSSDLVNWTDTNLTSFTDMCTDGQTVWVCAGDAGIFSAPVGEATFSDYASGTVDNIAWVADRLMASAGPALYNVLDSGPITQSVGGIPQLLLTHPTSSWTWSCYAFGSGQIYIGGYAPDASNPTQSAVYRTTIESTGTALQVPVISLPMAGGEAVTALDGDINFIFVGTNLGLRMCRTIAAYDPSGNAGDLEAGPLVPNLLQPVTAPIYAITSNNRFVYFGWTNYDDDTTGIGRCDISTFIDTLAPAYCSDLMCAGQGTVSWLDWFAPTDQPIISIDGVGVFTQAPTFVGAGSIESGYSEFGIPDDKVAIAGLLALEQPVLGSASMSVGVDQGTVSEVAFQPGGSPSISPFPISQIRGGLFSVRTSLMSDGDFGNTPTLFRWMLKALPTLVGGTVISVVLILHKSVQVQDGDQWVNVYAEKAYLEGLRQTQEIITYVEGPFTAPVTVDEIDWLPFKLRDEPGGGYEGDCTVYLKVWSIRG